MVLKMASIANKVEAGLTNLQRKADATADVMIQFGKASRNGRLVWNIPFPFRNLSAIMSGVIMCQVSSDLLVYSEEQ